MKKRRLKPFVKTTIVSICLVICIVISMILLSDTTSEVSKTDDNYIYVNDYIFDNYYPVVNQEEKIIRPYSSKNVSIHKNFYEKDSSVDEQKNSIIFHEGIYMQNSGTYYKSEESFDIISSLSGTVTNITDDALLGKTIEIRNSTELIVMYQSLGEVLVKKGDIVNQGQVIAKSGTCALNSDVKQGLHLEIYINGVVINPEKYYDKSLKDLSNN